MRAIVDSLMLQVDGVTEDNLYGSGAINEDSVPDRVFLVLRMGPRTPGMGAAYRQSIAIWVHDDPGDYTRIDRIVQGIYGRLNGAEHVVAEGVVGEIMTISWESTSDDLYDPGFRTITKSINFTAVGTGA